MRLFVAITTRVRPCQHGTGGTARVKSVPRRAVPAKKILNPCRAVPGKNRAGTEILNYLIVKIRLK